MVRSTSDFRLSNDGSTIQNGHFFDDIKPFEIKVPNSENCKILKKSNFASTKLNFRKQIDNNEPCFFWRMEVKLNINRHLWNVFYSIVNFWIDQMWYYVLPKHLKSKSFNFKDFVVQKQINLEFHSNCSWRVPGNRPSIWSNFTSSKFKIGHKKFNLGHSWMV